jgi:hypothetical protein
MIQEWFGFDLFQKLFAPMLRCVIALNFQIGWRQGGGPGLAQTIRHVV